MPHSNNKEKKKKKPEYTRASLYHLINKLKYTFPPILTCTNLMGMKLREHERVRKGNEHIFYAGIKGLLLRDKSSHYVDVCHLPPERGSEVTSLDCSVGINNFTSFASCEDVNHMVVACGCVYA